eukprot:COSAG01_NODE_21472_length_900_cov_2.324594_1_plen_114_part_10
MPPATATATAFLASASRQDNRPNRLRRPPLPRYSRSRVVRIVGSGATVPHARKTLGTSERATQPTPAIGSAHQSDWFRTPLPHRRLAVLSASMEPPPGLSKIEVMVWEKKQAKQ